MNILMISSAYYPIVGGGETIVRQMSEGLAQYGNSVTVISDIGHNNIRRIERLNGVSIIRLGEYKKIMTKKEKIPLKEFFNSLLGEIKSIQLQRPDIIHAHNPIAVLIGSMLKEHWNCPLIASFYETLPENKPFGRGKSRFIFKYMPYSRIIAPSQYFYNQAIAFGADPEKISLVYPGIDLARFCNSRDNSKRIRQRLGIAEEDKVILLVGRFTPRKGHLDFIAAMEKIIVHQPNAKAIFVGTLDDGNMSYFRKIKKKIASLHLQQFITIHTDLTWEEMPDVFAVADVVVQPSHYEGLGIAVIEAMASGTAVIGTNIDGLNEVIIDETNGLLVPPSCPDSLANGILRLLSDSDLRLQLSNNAKAWVAKRFNLRKSVELTQNIYQKVINSYN